MGILLPAQNVGFVEAYVASWIEIRPVHEILLLPMVEAYVASWIEIRIPRPQ